MYIYIYIYIYTIKSKDISKKTEDKKKTSTYSQ